MVGYIDVGGGLRAVYGTGVLDFCLDNGVNFPYLIGVSAGCGNIASYLAKQKGRSLKFYTDFVFRREYMSLHNLIKNGSYIDLDYIYSILSNEGGECPLDFDTMSKSKSQFVVVASNAQSGEAEYFTMSDIARNSYDVFKASCCIPVINKAFSMKDRKYYDGGIADPIPIRKAFLDGCDKVVVCLTRPEEYRKKEVFNEKMCRCVMREYPQTAQLLYSSAQKYNEDIEYLIKLRDEGRVLIIAPKTCCGVETLSKKRKNIEKLYALGYNDAKRIIEFLQD